VTRSRLEDVLPLTPLQEGMLFHAMYDEQAADAYLVQLTIDLAGPLKPERLRGAAAALLRRHPNLRAGFWQDRAGRPVQLIPREAELPWRQADLAALGPAARDERATSLLGEERDQRFDMSRPPLMRALLLRLAPHGYRLALTHHHILLDGWSLPIVLAEFFALYADGADGTCGDGLAPATPYREYLRWLASQDRPAATAAWRQALAGLREPTRIAAGTAATAPAPPARLLADLPEGPAMTLAESMRARGLTVNTAVQGAWALLLGAVTGRRDVVFGGVVAGRPPLLPGIETMVGSFINTIPVRARWCEQEPAAQFLARLLAPAGPWRTGRGCGCWPRTATAPRTTRSP
jgi:hypothetical protein